MNRSVLVWASLTSLLLSVFGTLSSQAATINVPADHATIQAAINAAAASGDTIIVAAGTYSENLTLNKSLILQGAQVGVNACGRVGSETIVNGGGTIRLELLTGSAGSIIDGFTLTGGSNTIESNTGGIAGIQILNNKINGFTSAGIFLDDSGTNITVGGNEVDAAAKTGGGASVHLDTDDFDGFWLTDNCIVYTGLNAFATGTGFFVDGNHNVGASLVRNPMITGNLITRHTTGANLGSRSFAANTLGALPSPGASDQGTISNNTFSFNRFDGLQGGIQRTLIDGNKFDSNGRSGLALTSFGNTGADRGAQGTTITNNCFMNNGQGSTRTDSLGAPLNNAGIAYSSSQLAGTISTNVTHDNSFSGNYRGAIYGNTCSSTGGSCSVATDCPQICAGGVNIGIPCTGALDCPASSCPVPTCTTAAGGAQTIDAESNFWGDASGPNSPPQNPAGTGDRVDTPNSLAGLIDLIPFSPSTALSCSSCTPANCDDGNPCTDDTCGPDGCVYTNNTAACDDGNVCTLADICRDGICVCDTPAGTLTTQIDVYLDLGAGLANDTRFDWSSAINGVSAPSETTCSHRRDMVFNCGFYNDSDGTGSGPRFVCSASFNATRGSSFPKNPGRAPQSITASGWYTFRHEFKAAGNNLVTDMDILPIGSAIPVASWTLADASDIVSGPGTNVGGSRYGYVVFNELPFLAIDNSMNASTGFNQGFEVDNSGWNIFGGANDATRVSSGTNGVASASGSFHGEAAQAFIPPDFDGSAFTDWGSDRNLRCAFPAGACPGPNCDDGNVCTDDICDPIDGCIHPFNMAPCEADKNPCSIDQCDGFGSCERVGFVDCGDPIGECDGGSFCDTDTGDCMEEIDPELSTPCDTDGTLCTREHCNGSGLCVPMDPATVECDPAVPPCEGGEVCNPETGECEEADDPPLSTPCNTDGTLCTREHCNGSGLCVPMIPGTVECDTAIPPCEGGEVCDPTTGLCEEADDPPLSTPCNTDGTLCTREHCNGSGLCVPMDPATVECDPAIPPCEGGELCDPTTGLCVEQDDAALSTPCTTDSDPCTNEHCNGDGQCVLMNDICGACCNHSPLGGVCEDRQLPTDCSGDQIEFFPNETCAVVEARGDCEEHTGACCDGDTFGSCQVLPGSQCICASCVFYKDETCDEIECLHNPIPTVSEWGMVVLTLLLLSGAKIYFGRRQEGAA